MGDQAFFKIDNCGNLGISLFLTLTSFASLTLWEHRTVSLILSIGGGSLTVAYIALLLCEAAKRPNENQNWFWKLPDLLWSIPLVLLLLCSLVCNFGGLYLLSDRVQNSAGKHLCGPLDAAYFSAVTITTLGYGDFAPTDAISRVLVLCELGCGVLLLLLTLPIVASRLALLGGSSSSSIDWYQNQLRNMLAQANKEKTFDWPNKITKTFNLGK